MAEGVPSQNIKNQQVPDLFNKSILMTFFHAVIISKNIIIIATYTPWAMLNLYIIETN